MEKHQIMFDHKNTELENKQHKKMTLKDINNKHLDKPDKTTGYDYNQLVKEIMTPPDCYDYYIFNGKIYESQGPHPIEQLCDKILPWIYLFVFFFFYTYFFYTKIYSQIYV